MHDLPPQTALGGHTPRRDQISTVLIEENTNIALASISARSGQDAPCIKALTALTGQSPAEVTRVTTQEPFSTFWMAQNQWMLCAPFDTHENLSEIAKQALGNRASVTEQTDAWGIFDVSGPPVIDLFERICAAPVRRMTKGDVQRTTIDHLGCFVLCLDAGHHMLVLGPRSAAGSLHHALCTAARSVV